MKKRRKCKDRCFKTRKENKPNGRYRNGASVDEICEVIRMIFFTCGVTKLLPILEQLDLEALELDE